MVGEVLACFKSDSFFSFFFFKNDKEVRHRVSYSADLIGRERLESFVEQLDKSLPKKLFFARCFFG